MKGKDRVVRDVVRSAVGVTSTVSTGAISFILTKAGGIILTKAGVGIQVK